MTLQLKRTDWSAFFDWVSQTLAGALAEIEVASLDIGHQVQVKWVTLLGIVYDSREDLIEIVIRDLDHMIRHPREVFIEEDTVGLLSVDIIDKDGAHQIVRFKQPLLLPSPDRPKTH